MAPSAFSWPIARRCLGQGCETWMTSCKGCNRSYPFNVALRRSLGLILCVSVSSRCSAICTRCNALWDRGNLKVAGYRQLTIAARSYGLGKRLGLAGVRLTRRSHGPVYFSSFRWMRGVMYGRKKKTVTSTSYSLLEPRKGTMG